MRGLVSKVVFPLAAVVALIAAGTAGGAQKGTVTFIIADQHRRRSRGWERALAIGCQLASIGVLVISASRTGFRSPEATASWPGMFTSFSASRRHG